MSEQLVASLAGPDDAPVVALGTSIGTHQGLWDPQAAVLGRRFRLLRFEFRGHGPAGAQSPAPPGPYRIAELGTDVLDVLNRYDLDRVAYCGVSLGGMVGMWLAANAPERISRLALCCTAAHMPPASMWEDRAKTARTEGLSALVEATTGRWFPAAFAARHPEAVAPVAAMFTGTDPEGYAGCAEAIAAMDQRQSITSISAPTLVVAGAEDPSTPPGQGARLARSIPGATLTVVRGAAHLANYQDPGPVTAALAAHLAPLLG
ncbi:MAG: 3-oxoadipate enol-lactonase [Actinobacteria bacterium]|nr:3-oxoadipate enol-lactonase [Actinomycetota bacterium]